MMRWKQEESQSRLSDAIVLITTSIRKQKPDIHSFAVLLFTISKKD
jgi:hypothetical protein